MCRKVHAAEGLEVFLYIFLFLVVFFDSTPWTAFSSVSSSQHRDVRVWINFGVVSDFSGLFTILFCIRVPRVFRKSEAFFCCLCTKHAVIDSCKLFFSGSIDFFFLEASRKQLSFVSSSFLHKRRVFFWDASQHSALLAVTTTRRSGQGEAGWKHRVNPDWRGE